MSTDTPGSGYPEHRCQGCGAHVTPDYRRVRGLEGKVHACPNCPTEHEHTPEEIAGLRTIGGGESR